VTWSYRVASNACFDELRRRRRRPEPGLPPVLADVTAVDDAVATRLDVDAALARLPEEFRVAVVLRDLCGLSYSDIGAVLRVPVGTVRSRIARGRASLVPLLEGNRTPPIERPRSS
jgi:RNA polymerase sigma-70 factor, ECF subfamily